MKFKNKTLNFCLNTIVPSMAVVVCSSCQSKDDKIYNEAFKEDIKFDYVAYNPATRKYDIVDKNIESQLTISLENLSNLSRKFTYDGEEYKLEIDTISLARTFDKDKTFSENLKDPNFINNQREYTYKIFKKNPEGKWKEYDKYDISKMTKKFDVKLNLVDNFDKMDTRIDYSKLQATAYDWDQMAKEGLNYHDAEILSWNDGDTPKVKYYDPNKKVTVEETIRIQGVDTPEKAVGKKIAPIFEKRFAEKSSEFAEVNLPPGTKVRFIYSNRDAFKRIVAHLFWGEKNGHKYVYEYSAAITRFGFTLPYADGTELINMIGADKTQHYTFLQIGEAFEAAMAEKTGFFKCLSDPDDISRYVYLLKRNGKYTIFQKKSNSNVFKFKDKAYKNPIN